MKEKVKRIYDDKQLKNSIRHIRISNILSSCGNDHPDYGKLQHIINTIKVYLSQENLPDFETVWNEV